MELENGNRWTTFDEMKKKSFLNEIIYFSSSQTINEICYIKDLL